MPQLQFIPIQSSGLGSPAAYMQGSSSSSLAGTGAFTNAFTGIASTLADRDAARLQQAALAAYDPNDTQSYNKFLAGAANNNAFINAGPQAFADLAATRERTNALLDLENLQLAKKAVADEQARINLELANASIPGTTRANRAGYDAVSSLGLRSDALTFGDTSPLRNSEADRALAGAKTRAINKDIEDKEQELLMQNAIDNYKNQVETMREHLIGSDAVKDKQLPALARDIFAAMDAQGSFNGIKYRDTMVRKMADSFKLSDGKPALTANMLFETAGGSEPATSQITFQAAAADTPNMPSHAYNNTAAVPVSSANTNAGTGSLPVPVPAAQPQIIPQQTSQPGSVNTPVVATAPAAVKQNQVSIPEQSTPAPKIPATRVAAAVQDSTVPGSSVLPEPEKTDTAPDINQIAQLGYTQNPALKDIADTGGAAQLQFMLDSSTPIDTRVNSYMKHLNSSDQLKLSPQDKKTLVKYAKDYSMTTDEASEAAVAKYMYENNIGGVRALARNAEQFARAVATPAISYMDPAQRALHILAGGYPSNAFTSPADVSKNFDKTVRNVLSRAYGQTSPRMAQIRESMTELNETSKIILDLHNANNATARNLMSAGKVPTERELDGFIANTERELKLKADYFGNVYGVSPDINIIDMVELDSSGDSERAAEILKAYTPAGKESTDGKETQSKGLPPTDLLKSLNSPRSIGNAVANYVFSDFTLGQSEEDIELKRDVADKVADAVRESMKAGINRTQAAYLAFNLVQADGSIDEDDMVYQARAVSKLLNSRQSGAREFISRLSRDTKNLTKLKELRAGLETERYKMAQLSMLVGAGNNAHIVSSPGSTLHLNNTVNLERYAKTATQSYLDNASRIQRGLEKFLSGR